ncbi:hypothetical protein [Vibrio owensii]|uniref:hypothetical protein n=1 Tax=Vibrio owensii TaxID=696485 RepID=UPI0038CDA2F4
MEVEVLKDNVAPYLSILMGVRSEVEGQCRIHEKIVQILNDDSDGDFVLGSTVREDVGEFGVVKITSYQVAKPPSWAKGLPFKDLEHHVFVSFSVGDYFAFYFSEKGKKDSVRDYFGKKRLANLRPIPISRLNGNFINEDEIKMLWLSGIHGRGNYKADSKVLGGNSVADTLDPLIDQSYMMSAVRTEIWGKKAKSSLGINPFKSSIWRGPCNDWKTFENRVLEILDKLAQNTNESESPISILSYPISDSVDLNEPYDFSLVDYDFLPEEEGRNRKELLLKLQYDYSAELLPVVSNSKISLKVKYKGADAGELSIEPKVDDYKVSFDVLEEYPAAKMKSRLETYTRIFRYPELVKCWFESGHAIVNGMIFRTGYQDVTYDKFIWAGYEGYDIEKEKPGKDPKKPELDKIGTDKSLFCWVKNHWNGDWLYRDGFNTTDNPRGWLYCDDGAGEKADFIHCTQHSGVNIVSLIHVKAANSSSQSRKISVGAHDVVLNQAVKNLRYCSRKTLIEDLRSRYEAANKKQCWFNGVTAEPKEFFLAIDALKNNATTKTRVIVVQPHTQKSSYESKNKSKIKTQLDVLLVSAENAIRSSGAEFHIIGFDDRK